MNIGLIAHDSKKALMQNFCIAYRGILSKHSLYATGTTGRLIEEVTNLKVHKYLAGPLGGKQQLGAQIAQNDIDALIFLREPSNPKPHDPFRRKTSFLKVKYRVIRCAALRQGPCARRCRRE